jgi:hypothetical protein
MKLYAQIGYGIGDKVSNGIREGLIDGAIFSPKDLQRSTLMARIEEFHSSFPESDLMIDPQYYASLCISHPSSNIGGLAEWNYFKSHRLGSLERIKTIHSVLEECYSEVCAAPVTHVIAPTIMISESLDSREAVVAKNFLRESREVYARRQDDRPLYASLVIHREALQDQREFEYFVNDITMLDEPPDGVYLVIVGRSPEVKSEIYDADVIANWMFLNYSLSLNGIKVINGYSDLLTPFLGAVGGIAGATGWWSNLRILSMERFCPTRNGGRQPVVRYLSKALNNRITWDEKEAISRFNASVINGLPHDADYNPEAERSQEILQSWEAIRSSIDSIINPDINISLKNCKNMVNNAIQFYAEIALMGLA